MVDPRCVDYIRANKDKYPLETLKQALLKAGASPADVEEAARLATAPPPPPPTPPVPAPAKAMPSFNELFPAALPSKPKPAAAPTQPPSPMRAAAPVKVMGLFSQARLMLREPAAFYRSMPPTGPWMEPVRFLLTMVLLSSVLRLVLDLAFRFSGLGLGGVTEAALAGLFSVVVALIVVPIATVVASGIAFVVWMVLGSTQPFETSLRCLVFMSALMPIQAAVQPLPVVGEWLAIPVALYGVYLFLPASTEVHQIEKRKAVILVGVLAALAFLGMVGSALAVRRMQDRLKQLEAIGGGKTAGLLQMPSGMRSQGSAGLPPEAAQAMQALSSTLGSVGADSSITAVVPDALKGLLPKELPDMPRASADSSRQRLGPMEMSAATGIYQAADGAKIEIQLIDAGSYSGLLSMAWGAAEVDQQTENGYRRTTTVRGLKALEEYDRANRVGSVQLIAAQRFAVKVVGRGADMKKVRAAFDSVDLDALGKMAH